MSNYLVIGDSFAICDDIHYHWFNIWAKMHGSTSTHLGFKADNPVNITSKLIDTNFSDYDAIIYQPTNLLRCQHAEHELISLNDVWLTSVKSLYDNLNTEWLEKANYNSMCYLFEVIKKHNVPLITISTLNEKEWDYDMPDIVDYHLNLGKMMLIDEPIFNTVLFSDPNQSDNHYNFDEHKRICRQFDYFVQKHHKIKTLLNK
jgi:hypothetical protein